MGNQALPERLKTTTTKSERPGWTKGRSRERVCAQINTNTHTHADRTLQKKKDKKKERKEKKAKQLFGSVLGSENST